MELNMEGMWDTHLHLFDPDLYPYKSTRTYTPSPASLDAWIEQIRADRLVLVQASIEDGPAGLIGHLGRIRNDYPRLLARGIICMDESWEKLTQADCDTLHNLGVRYCRIHGFFGGGRTDTLAIKEQISVFANSYPCRTFGWGLSAQLPLDTWSSLKDFLLNDPEVSHLSVIADHVGCAKPTDIGQSSLHDFVQLLQSGRINVKISALYRRSGESLADMKSIIRLYADSAPFALIWGSDWPHVDSSSRSSKDRVTSIAADPNNEIMLLRSWLSKDQFRSMLVDNPERLFAH
ncbi:hypothetical protein N7478_006305 [Penicillium angulare]|uniref:uncharacterized protein n=1 Tax=Penicillium angulare TaxID=116970 RepID=UPI0025414DEC|nr:uncharacterized protein N7478_006305 [Penicillium angulare]KAJ5280933.1 hypothetical protein N7478_006305 [Penicillium angulare]